MSHALLSASSSKKWINCPPSARLEEQFPDTASQYAKEGTLAHSIAELKVRKYFMEPMSQRTYNSRLKKLQKDELYDPEMLTHTDTYLEYTTQRLNGIAFQNILKSLAPACGCLSGGAQCFMDCTADTRGVFRQSERLWVCRRTKRKCRQANGS